MRATYVHWVWFGVPCSTEMSSHGRVDRGSSSLEYWGARFHGPRPRVCNAAVDTLGVGVLLLSILPDGVLCYSSVTASLSDGLGGNALYASHRALSQHDGEVLVSHAEVSPGAGEAGCNS